MATTIRVLDRVARDRGDPSLVTLAVQSAHLAIVPAYASVTVELARETGAPEPSPAISAPSMPPAKDRDDYLSLISP